ncbi:unnamed protein product [Effrenium voratum]|nr:unnamed protein product [Effrenium voratum]
MARLLLLAFLAPKPPRLATPRHAAAAEAAAGAWAGAREALLYEDWPGFRAWLSTKPDLEAEDERGWTMLMQAAEWQKAEAAQLLLEARAFPRALDAEMSALHLAARGPIGGGEAEPRILELLVHHKAHVDAQDATGTTPLMLAAAYGHMSTARCLVRLGADVTLKDGDGLAAANWSATEHLAQWLSESSTRT